jgi:hypothetical protein
MTVLKPLRWIGPGLIILLIATAAVVEAEPFQFGDVVGDEYYADGVYNLRDAGITNGCRGGADYCPTIDVSRGQMAAFLDRGLPGVVFSPYLQNPTPVGDTDGPVTLHTVDVETTGVGGTQYVQVAGQASVYINGEQDSVCSADPCSAQLYVIDASEQQIAVGEVRISSDDFGLPIHIEAVVPVANQDSPHWFQLRAETTNVAGDVFVIDHSLAATVFPMDASA